MKLLRRLRRALNTGPACDRCGNPTGKPYLYNMPSTWWRCAPCENAVTEILFQLAEQGHLTDRHLLHTRPVRNSDS